MLYFNVLSNKLGNDCVAKYLEIFIFPGNLTVWEMVVLEGLQFHEVVCVPSFSCGPVLMQQSFEYLQMCFSLLLCMILLKTALCKARANILTPFFSFNCIVSAMMLE